MSRAYYNVQGDNKNMITDKICKKVKLERIKAGLTQEELAFESGLNRNSIQKIETGKVSPSIKSLEKIAKALNMDFYTLIDITKFEI